MSGDRDGDGSGYERLVRAARQLIVSRDFDAARAHLEQAIDEDDRRPEAFNLLAVIEEVRGDRCEARVHWRVALVLAPDYEPAQENLRRATRRPRTRDGLSLG